MTPNKFPAARFAQSICGGKPDGTIPSHGPSQTRQVLAEIEIAVEGEGSRRRFWGGLDLLRLALLDRELKNRIFGKGGFTLRRSELIASRGRANFVTSSTLC
jgi:hypothetical protein